jgi:hypothetical protein
LAVAVSALVCAQATANITIEASDGYYWTDAVWTLDTAPTDFTDIAPDSWTNGAGEPSAGVYVEGLPAIGPLVATSGTVYASPVMRVDLDVPNIIDDRYEKIVQVELVYWTQNTVGSGYMDSVVELGGGLEIDPDWYIEDVTIDDQGTPSTADDIRYADLTVQFSFP